VRQGGSLGGRGIATRMTASESAGRRLRVTDEQGRQWVCAACAREVCAAAEVLGTAVAKQAPARMSASRSA